jgi:riboflavin kinase
MLEKLGYVPYPGTLNLRLNKPSETRQKKKLRERKGVRIEAFDYKGERFSGLNCFDGEMNGVRVTLLIIEITHYDDSVMELISPAYLRGELGLRDGDRVTVTIGSS